MIKNIENKIAATEESLEELQGQLCLEEVYSNPEKSIEINKEIQKTEEELQSLYEQWEELA